ncbi:hypothetical protein K8R66_00590 [bacterium]|nr:hypothetical protein [bacterium]
MVDTEKKSFLNKIVDYFSRESVGIKVIFLVGALALFLGFWNMSSGIKNAFTVSPLKLEDRAGMIESLNRLKDTDKDGISDYEEENFYGTSPYLADTDLDGISDYEEMVLNNTTCADGSCDTITVAEKTNELDIFSLGSDAVFDAQTLSELKPYLIQMGYPESLIDNLEGESMSNVATVLEEFGAQSSSIDLDQSQLDEFKNLNTEQIRALLIQSGAKAEDLEDISDDDLQKAYQQVLSEM